MSPFNRDAEANAGYLYTTEARLSCQIANARMSDAALAFVRPRGVSVIDIGCGDGTYTVELFDRGQPARLHGVDPAEAAIDVARQKAASRPIVFQVGSAYDLPHAADSFDVACLRGVLHHLDHPVDALREALRVAARVVVVEPNGYNPVLKVLERVSPYHRRHEEKSFAPAGLDRWVRDVGGRVDERTWIGLVPMFCPDWMARALKAVEPLVEGIPVVRSCACAQYVMAASRPGGSGFVAP